MKICKFHFEKVVVTVTTTFKVLVTSQHRHIQSCAFSAYVSLLNHRSAAASIYVDI